MKTTFYNKDGSLSEYAYSCGYIQKIDTSNIHKELYKEHGIYHVRSTHNNVPELSTLFDGQTSHNFIIWMSYYKLTDAKLLYSKIK